MTVKEMKKKIGRVLDGFKYTVRKERGVFKLYVREAYGYDLAFHLSNVLGVNYAVQARRINADYADSINQIPNLSVQIREVTL